jgi:hypothetical protein
MTTPPLNYRGFFSNKQLEAMARNREEEKAAASPVPPSAHEWDEVYVNGTTRHCKRCRQACSCMGICVHREPCDAAPSAVQGEAELQMEDRPDGLWVRYEYFNARMTSLETERDAAITRANEWHQKWYEAVVNPPAAAPVEGAIPTEPTSDDDDFTVDVAPSWNDYQLVAADLARERKLSTARRNIAEGWKTRALTAESENARLLNELEQGKRIEGILRRGLSARRTQVESLTRELAGYREVVERAIAALRDDGLSWSGSIRKALTALSSLPPTPTGDPIDG